MQRQLAAWLGLLLLVGVGWAGGRNTETTPPSTALTVQHCTRTATSTRLALSFAPPQWVNSADHAEYLAYESGVWLREEQRPLVTRVSGMVRLPPTGGCEVAINDADYVTFTDVVYAAWCEGQATAPSQELDELPDAWFPEEVVLVGQPGIFHDFRVTTLNVHPVQVNPARREVRVYRNLDITVRYTPDAAPNPLPASPTRLSKTFIPFYRELLDWDEGELDEYELYRGGVQVVMRDDDDLMELMAEWFEWKRQKGWTLELLTDSDVVWNFGSIRSELQTRYAEAETPFDYVVIIGDDTGLWTVPPGSGAGYGGGDLEYSLVAGNDDIVDVAIGRISIATTIQAADAVDKLVGYETDPPMADSGWFQRGLVQKSNTFVAFCEQEEVLRQIRRQLLSLGYTQVDTLFMEGGAQAVPYLDAGISYYLDLGYLGTWVQPADIADLSSMGELPVVQVYSHGSGNWTSGNGINEYWFRASAEGQAIGAIAAFGVATSGSDADYMNVLATGASYAALVLRHPAVGAMNVAAKLSLYNNYYDYEYSSCFNHLKWHNLIGDPTTWLWTAPPAELDVAVDTVLAPGRQALRVEVTCGDVPVENAWVTLFQEGEVGSLQLLAETTPEGIATLQFNTLTEGEMLLTVTAQNALPVQQTIHIETDASPIAINHLTTYEDGSYQSQGDGDGVVENGERVALQIGLRNQGEVPLNNLILAANASDPWASSITGSIVYESILPGLIYTGAGVILVTIDPNAPDDWLVPLELTITDDGEDRLLYYQLPVAAPQLSTPTTIQGWAEGTHELAIEIHNLGGGDAAPGFVNLISRHQNVTVTESQVTMDWLSPGDSEVLDFTAAVDSGCFRGYPADMGLVFDLDDGSRRTVPFVLQLGEPGVGDPTGPDRYGYLAFDHLDTAYTDHAPEFNWIEINPFADEPDFNGFVLPLEDEGLNGDDAVAVELPFPVQYYGDTFETLTVTTNGIAMFGNQEELPFMRNRTIPDPLGPANMLAPFWDLLGTDQNTAICTYYDGVDGRFIIEWYQIKQSITQSATFELIFYDVENYPTVSGDNLIEFQYLDFTLLQGSGYYDPDYWTTGIENGRQDDGLLYCYWNEYQPGARPLTNESAIRFVPTRAPAIQVLQGQVIASSDSTLIEGAVVDLLFEGVAVTDSLGRFQINAVSRDTLSVTVEASCFTELDTLLVFGVSDTLDVILGLPAPGFELSELAIADTVAEGDSAIHVISLENAGNGPLYYSVERVSPRDWASGKQFHRRASELDDAWERLHSFALSSEETRYNGIAFDGTTFWISGSNNFDAQGPNLLYRYSEEGQWLGTCEQPLDPDERTATGMRGLDFAGGYLYGADDGVLYQMRFENDSVRVINMTSIPVNPARVLIVDEERELYWVGDYGTSIYGVDRDGIVHHEFGREAYNFTGGDILTESTQPCDVTLLSWDADEAAASVVRLLPERGDYVADYCLQQDRFDERPVGGSISRRVIPGMWTYTCISGHETGDSVVVLEIRPYTDWVTVEPEEGVVLPGENGEIEVLLSATGLEPELYRLDLLFSSNACTENPNRVAVQMMAPGENVEPGTGERPLAWALDPVWPNPFNPTVRIRYGLRETTDVRLRVFDILGRQVAVLAERPQAAGWHTVSFTADHLASGMYFLVLEAGPLHETRKMVLLK